MDWRAEMRYHARRFMYHRAIGIMQTATRARKHLEDSELRFEQARHQADVDELQRLRHIAYAHIAATDQAQTPVVLPSFAPPEHQHG